MIHKTVTGVMTNKIDTEFVNLSCDITIFDKLYSEGFKSSIYIHTYIQYIVRVDKSTHSEIT